jgi:hypothetical protein
MYAPWRSPFYQSQNQLHIDFMFSAIITSIAIIKITSRIIIKQKSESTHFLAEDSTVTRFNPDFAIATSALRAATPQLVAASGVNPAEGGLRQDLH